GSPTHAPRQVIAQRLLDRLIGAHQVVVDLHVARLAAQLLAERLEIGQVLRPRRARVDEQTSLGLLQAAKLRAPREGELDLLGGQQVQQQDLVPLVAKVPQRQDEVVELVEAIRED